MAVNEDFQGRSYEPTPPFDVGREHIRDFAAAVGATDPIHTDVEAARAAGYADLVAPPTFAVIPGQRTDRQFVVDPEAGVDYTRVVHGEQRFTHHRPIVAGDELRGVLHIDAIRAAGGHQMVTMRSEIIDAHDEPVATSLSTIVVRGGE
ncbi:FAS1-like dehydratase domain-containing protein [Janibacter sp. G349]|jgi:acyl dehydratase|uniref:FAS1-like dehydratase domain-containing protein n=1 Tax=unclassified Janibacter TaxID=2649294 RepID=UPI0020CDAED7|nr:MaoC family dehydratase N-terminal domain-containing protein [Janibacter sp. CX7]UTT66626.1 MaoC family dehydratase N-terminal domain-containing protein [Janibacter sp. CX7]